jgi:diadenosine tetraphosphate (Ap4A) HIT family hydrolase
MACFNNARVGRLPPREAIEVTAHWRVAHAYNSALPGWLVVGPRRHVAALHELESFEASPLGDVLYRASTALRRVVQCNKAYVMFFAEKEGHSHVHFHVVPRMRDSDKRSAHLSEHLVGPPASGITPVAGNLGRHVPGRAASRTASAINGQMARLATRRKD